MDQDRLVADIVCPIDGMPIEMAQVFIRPSNEKEYSTIRCMADHYITMATEELELLVVGDSEDVEFYLGPDEDEPLDGEDDEPELD